MDTHSVTEPTCGRKVFDVLLINERLSICDVSVLLPFDSSDHSQVLFKVFVQLPAESSEPTKHIFSDAGMLMIMKLCPDT